MRGTYGENRDVITICPGRVFHLEEALRLLPIVRRITHEFSVRVETLMNCLENVNIDHVDTISRLESEMNELIVQWHKKIIRLGAQPKGLWVVNFDSEDGYYCWKYPEGKLNHWHSYETDFTHRIPLQPYGNLDLPSS